MSVLRRYRSELIHLSTGYLNDLHVYDPAKMKWAEVLTALPSRVPSPRCSHGFTALDGRLYVQGGWNGDGENLSICS